MICVYGGDHHCEFCLKSWHLPSRHEDLSNRWFAQFTYNAASKHCSNDFALTTQVVCGVLMHCSDISASGRTHES